MNTRRPFLIASLALIAINALAELPGRAERKSIRPRPATMISASVEAAGTKS